MRFISVLTISISSLAALSEKSSSENTVVNERVGTDQEHETLTRTNEEEKALLRILKETPAYQFSSSTKHICPKCGSEENIKAFLKTAKNKILKCQNTECSLILKSNDINRIFADLFYDIVDKNLPFSVFKDLYRLYAPETKSVNHFVLMNVLIASQTIPLHNQNKIWNSIAQYMDYYQIDNGHLFYAYNETQKLDSDEIALSCSKLTPEEKIEAVKIKALISHINSMWSYLDEFSEYKDFLIVYQGYIIENTAEFMRSTLADYFMSYLMRFKNPFAIMDELYFLTFNTLSLQQSTETASIMVDNITSFLTKSNADTIEKMHDAYLKSNNGGVLTQVLIYFYKAEEYHAMARQIIIAQLARLDEFYYFKDTLRPDAMRLIKKAHSCDVGLTLDHIEKILECVHSYRSELSDKDALSIALLLKKYIKSRPDEICEIIEEIFAKYYTTNNGKIYARCMPSRFFKHKNNEFSFIKKRINHYIKVGINNGSELAHAEQRELLSLREIYLQQNTRQKSNLKN
ncbi:hypothetical protein ENBRE01_0716 [Enteropsectra breve]|nr:hypothetical protein ENBRE01_0716 [Enteropsectra breve]